MSRRYFASAGGFCMVVINKTATDETPTVASTRPGVARSISKSNRTSPPTRPALKRD